MPKADTAPRPRPAPSPAPPAGESPRVAIVGGGLAGLTAALRLAQRGFKVTLYEEKPRLGGNLSSDEADGVFHDVYPHMFCHWYANFWDLFENDLGLARDAHFEARMGVKLLEPGAAEYKDLKSASTPTQILHNLLSGVLSPPDMFLLGFAGLDLASHPFNRQGSNELDRLDVNGFIYSRGYSTEKVAALQNYILMVIWSIQSDVTAAASYQDFIRHALSFPKETPFAWMLKGDLYQTIIVPFEQKLKALGCDIQTGRKVVRVALAGGQATLTLEGRLANGVRAQNEDAPPADYVVLATPAPALAKLVMEGAPGERVVDVLPHLSELQRFRDTAIAVVDVYFTKTLPNIPKEQVGFAESDIDLTMLDISQLWTDDPNMQGRTALVLAASNSVALPSLDPFEQGYMMIRRLHDYLPLFEPGDHWGDPKADICWDMSSFRSNDQNRLFINDIGSWAWRPVESYPEAPNLFFAGDFCKTDVDMATIEAAVQSGLLAAKALQGADAARSGTMRGAPVTMAKHEVYSNAALLAAKLVLLPVAYAATAWSGLTGDAPLLRKGPLPKDAYLPSSYVPLLPLAYALDWWKTVYWLVRNLAPGSDDDPDAPGGVNPAKSAATPAEPAAPGEILAELAARTLSAAGDALQAVAARLPSKNEPPSRLGAALTAFSDQAWRAVRAAASQAPGLRPDGDGYQRRWRVKR